MTFREAEAGPPREIKRGLASLPEPHGVDNATMEETAACPDAVGVLDAMAIDRPGCPAMLMDAWSGGMQDTR